MPVRIEELGSEILGHFSLLGDSPPALFLGMWVSDVVTNDNGHVFQRQYLHPGQRFLDTELEVGLAERRAKPVVYVVITQVMVECGMKYSQSIDFGKQGWSQQLLPPMCRERVPCEVDVHPPKLFSLRRMKAINKHSQGHAILEGKRVGGPK